MNKQKLIYTIMGMLIFSTLFAFVLIGQKSNDGNITSSFLQDKKGSIKRDSENEKLNFDRRNSITKAVEQVSPAVVGINVNIVRKYRDFWSEYYKIDKELGSGVLISPDGFILTNDHVVSGNDITVTLTDGTHLKANKIGSDPYSDICLLKINAGKTLPYVNFGDSDDIIIGEWVIALGNPFGLFDKNDKPSVSVGVVSSINMNMGIVGGRSYVDMIQTDAAINPGNSGGPLVNVNGELIGLDALIRGSNEGIQANIGLGFAIPVNKIKRIITELKEKGEIDRDFIRGFGLYYLPITDELARANKLSTTKGVVVSDVDKDSPAAKAGLKPLDIITQLGKYKTYTKDAFDAVIFEFRTGDSVPLTIIRGTQTLNLTLKLEKFTK